MEINIDKTEKCLKIKLIGRFMANAAKEFETIVIPEIKQLPNAIFDLSEMTHIDSCGLAALTKALQLTKKLNGSLILAGLRPQPMIVFNVTKFSHVFDMVETVEEAEKMI